MPGINDVFESIFTGTIFNDQTIVRVPAVDISEIENNYHMEMASPGLKKEDFKLNLEQNNLTTSVQQNADRYVNRKELY